jgi:glycine/D-amino acid oxidase-like deaminating enzyme
MLRKLTYFALLFSLLKFSYCTEIDDLPEERNTIAVIGGGYTGVISAILLAKLKIFDVHLFEKDMVLMNGASAATARLHLGGEYLEDEKTAKQCLFSALLFRQMFPTESILADIQYIKFLTAMDSLEEISVEKIRTQYKKLQSSYKKKFDQLKELWQTSDEETGNRLFGDPSLFVEDAGIDPECIHFAGGIKTKERGLQPISLGVMLEELLEQHGVILHLGCTVTKASYSDENEGYNLFYKSQHSQNLFANYVVSAAWHRNNYLATKIGASSSPPDTSQKVFLRAIGLFDVSRCENQKNCGYFGFKGIHGGMVSY